MMDDNFCGSDAVQVILKVFWNSTEDTTTTKWCPIWVLLSLFIMIMVFIYSFLWKVHKALYRENQIICVDKTF